MQTITTAFPSISKLASVACACVALAGYSSAQAAVDPVSLASLIANNGVIQSGDKEFSNFGYVSTSASFPTAADIQVQGDLVGANYGIDFVSGWHANPGQGLQTAKLTYTVSILGNPDLHISDIHLDGDPTLIGNAGQSIVKLSASDMSHTTVLPPNSVLQIYQTMGNPAVVNAFANTFGAPANLRSLEIETTILGSADALNGTASVLHIQESFSQAVPEPSTFALMLMGLGVVGFAARSTRRSVG